MNFTTMGLDIAKNVFAVCGLNEYGKVVMQRKLKRAEVLTFFAKLPACLVGIEACSGAHYWARELFNLGHTVKLIPAQHVKRFLLGDKTDARDAVAIAEAVKHPMMRFVPVNTEVQQDWQMVHRIRQRLSKQRVALLVQTRSFLHEYGLVFPKGARKVEAFLRDRVLTDNHFSGLAKQMWQDLMSQLQTLNQQIKTYDKYLEQICNTDEAVKRVKEIPGIGVQTATALVASVGNASHFKNGRCMAASMGLVPREFSSGGKQKQYGITKRGGNYVRMLAIQGARSVLLHAKGKTDRLSQWALKLKEKKGFNVAAVALANKIIRLAYVVLARNTPYNAHHLMT